MFVAALCASPRYAGGVLEDPLKDALETMRMYLSADMEKAYVTRHKKGLFA